MEKILTVQSLSKHFGSISAVDSLRLEIPKGSVFGLLGPNGSGKTTTLGMVLGVIRPSSGSFKWFGEDLSFSVKRKIGALLETPNFYPYLSAYDNLKIIAAIKEIPRPDLEGILRTVHLYGRAHSRFSTYSLGMKQRLAIAAALLSNPEVLVLDEPTNGLDPQGISEIRSIIKEIAGRGITVILASHLLDEIEKICSHVAVMRQGKLLFSGTVDELTGHEGTIEIAAKDTEALKRALQDLPGIEKITERETGMLTLILSNGTDAASVNEALAQQGIYAHHLVFRKNSLEKQFLNLIKDQNS